MKSCFLSFFAMLLAMVILPVTCNKSSFEKDFKNPPANTRIGVYWYWMRNNITKEGVVNDLNAMKKAGITRAFIGNIGGETNYPEGDIKILTDRWWDVLHTALKTATKLDIEIGIFNCPGWSQSGGPWIKPEQSMRYLASVDTTVTGPVKFCAKLVPKVDNFQDVKVIAFPNDAHIHEIQSVNVTTTQSPNRKPGAGRRERFDVIYTVGFDEKQIANTLVFRPTSPIKANAELQSLNVATGQFETVKEFVVDRSNPALNVGFDPYAPIVIGIKEIRSSKFRFILKDVSKIPTHSDLYITGRKIIERYPEKTLAKMFQTPLPLWADYMWDSQSSDPGLSINPENVVDISSCMAEDGTITWDVPDKCWVIMRTGMTPTGVKNSPASKEGTGLEVDKTSKENVKYHFDNFVGEILRRIPAADRKSFKVVVADSYETGSQNFTDGILDEFRAKYGYDPVPYLPAIYGYVIGSPDISDRFLWDLRRLIADKIAYGYVAGLRDAANEHGLTTWLQNYGHWGFPSEFLQYGGQSDEVSGEFWADGDLGSIECRAASSCAHIYGKNTVSCESFTSGTDWSHNPTLLKSRGDWSFTEGINKTLLHVYIQQPYEGNFPGVDAWFGTEFNRHNTWFGHLDLFTEYLRRCNYMLQQGQNIADVAYFIGEDCPKMTGIQQPEIPKGYSFDYINAEVILRDLTVKDGLLTLPHGTAYRILVLPPQTTMRPELLEKILQLVSDGAIIIGNPPTSSPSLQDYPIADDKIAELANETWGTIPEKVHTCGKGKILTGTRMEEAFEMLGIIPDCRIDTASEILYTHRKAGDTDIYFVSNQSNKEIETKLEFRVQNRQPELWDATTGEIRILPAFASSVQATAVPLRFAPHESMFIVFRKLGKPEAGRTSVEDNFPEQKTIAGFAAPWSVKFNSDSICRGPSEPVAFDRLTDWSENKDPAIKYYSGTAIYSNKFDIVNLNDLRPATIYLSFDKIAQMAKIRINGRYAGGIWTAPYRIDITRFVKEGVNTVEIETVNTWKNRMIGDARLPEEQRLVKATTARMRPDKPLQESGIIGEAKITTINY
ncbi:MAG: glycoside hydrolase family 2 [Dysgonamonadaceae bacterium]|jgi:hypothetical protein|nr:glycoside hydrolase family 2 [Dysgonamonadaceae bacterium]